METSTSSESSSPPCFALINNSWRDANTNWTVECPPVDVHTRMNPYPPWVVIFLWLLTALFSVETILGNLLVLMAYKLERNIRRQLSNRFIVSLAITDLIIGMEGFPLLTVYVVGRERWPLGHLLCQFWLFLDYTLCLVSILNVLLITVDRYGSVCYPAKYRVWQTRHRVRVFIFGSWIVPCVLFGIMIFAWEPMTGVGMDDSGKCYAPFLNDPYVNMSMYIIYYWTTLGAMTVLYRGIHTAAKTLEDKSKARERQTIALLLGQRCMAQVGVGMLLHSSASDEDEENIESFFHSPTTADGGYATDECATADLARDASNVTTTSATMANTVANSTTIQTGYQPLLFNSDSDEKTPFNNLVPVTIVTPIAVSLPESPSIEKNKFLQKRILYSEFGEGEDEEDLSFSLVPLIDRSSIDVVNKPPKIDNNNKPLAKPASTASLFAASPSRSKFYNTYNSANTRRSSSLRRVLAPMNNYGGVATIASKARRTKLIPSLSLDDDKIGSIVGRNRRSIDQKKTYGNNEFENPLFDRQSIKSPRVDSDNGIEHQSQCSLEFYDSSNKGSVGSIYGDTSLHSIVDFGTFVSGIDNPDVDEILLASAPGSMENSMITAPLKIQPNGDLVRALGRASSISSSLSSAASSKTWTRSESTSVRSQSSANVVHDHLPISTTAVSSSSSSPAKLIHLADDDRLVTAPRHSYTQTPVCARPSVQIKISPDHAEILTPIIEEEKSTANTVSRPNSAAQPPFLEQPGRCQISPPSSRGRQGTKRHRADQKVVHLTVPGSSSGSGGSSSQTERDRRKGSSTSVVGKNKNKNKKQIADQRRAGTSDADWNRASWQSTTSSVYDPKRANSRRLTRGSNIDDDDDSCGSGQAVMTETRASSTTENRKGSHWLVTLFNNPTSILNRKRKVTRAERRARKAFRTITVIVGTFALFWSPYYIVATIYGFCPDCVPAPLFLTSYYLCYLNSSVNPFAYAFANRLFRKTFIRILKGDLRRT